MQRVAKNLPTATILEIRESGLTSFSIIIRHTDYIHMRERREGEREFFFSNFSMKEENQ